MKVFAGMDPRMPMRDIAGFARRVESMGYDGLHVPETIHDAFAVSLLAAEHTERIVIRTSVALAFVRSPLLTAYAAWDLAQFSGGRFELGLGSQIKQNIQDRYGMPWSEPVGRMRDYVTAVQDIFHAFQTGERLHHEGDHYRITRMQPYFNPGPDPSVTAPPMWLGGVNAGICQLAGELVDGIVTHPTNSNPRYLEEICLPNLALGAGRVRRDPSTIALFVGTQVITGATTAEVDAERERQRRMLAFLYSTPSYRRTLELYGWEDMTARLQALIRADKWDDLPAVITDDVLATLVPTATYDELAPLLIKRFGGVATGLHIKPPDETTHDDAIAEVIAALQEN